jgi:VanZ family protein
VEDVARRRLAAWLPPVAWAVALLVLSAQPSDRLPPPGFWGLDKLVHGGLYAVLGALTGRALRRGRSPVAGWALVAAAVGLVGFGAFDEWTQSFTPGRLSSAADVVADAVGGWAGLLAAARYDGRRHGTHPPLPR